MAGFAWDRREMDVDIGGVSVSTYTHGLRRHERRYSIIFNDDKDGMALVLDGYTGGQSEKGWSGVISICRSFGGDWFRQITGSHGFVGGPGHMFACCFFEFSFENGL